MPEPPDHPNVDELVARLRERVEERRRTGRYPPGLEQDLAEHFRRIAAHRSRLDLDEVHRLISDAEGRAAFDPGAIPLDSRMPGGRAMHRAVAKAVSRQTVGVLQQMHAFAVAVTTALRATAQAIETAEPMRKLYTELLAEVDAIQERLAAYERTPGDAGIALMDLRRRVEELEAAEDRRSFRPWFTNECFEEEFRGSHAELLDRYRDLARRVVGCAPVLDIGCGRGEFLELLRDLGVDASGVELDQELAKEAAEAGLDVVHGDGLRHLAAFEEGSLGGVVLIQVVEHLSPQQVVDFVALVAEKVRVGGKVLVETINPQSLYVYAHSFHIDPTHVHPVHPAYLTFLFREAGFAEVGIDWRSPPPADDRLLEVPVRREADVIANANTERLNRLLFAPQDFALVATR